MVWVSYSGNLASVCADRSIILTTGSMTTSAERDGEIRVVLDGDNTEEEAGISKAADEDKGYVDVIVVICDVRVAEGDGCSTVNDVGIDALVCVTERGKTYGEETLDREI